MATVKGSIIINNQFSNTLNQLNSGLKQSMNAIQQLQHSMSQQSGSTFASNFKAGFDQLDGSTRKSGSLIKATLGSNLVKNGVAKGVGLAAAGVKSLIGELESSSSAWQAFNGNTQQVTTLGQAMDGLQKTLVNKLSPAYAAVSKVGVEAIGELSNKISAMDFSGVQSKVATVANGIVNGLKVAGSFVAEFWQSMSNTSAISAASAAMQSLGDAMKNISNAFTGGASLDSLADSLGRLAGSAVTGAANAIKSVSDAIKQMSPGQIKGVAIAIGSLVAAVKAISLIKGGMKLADTLGLGEIGPAAAKAVKGVISAFSGGGILPAIEASFSGIGGVVSTAFGPVILVVAAVTAVIAGAVMAWQSNFMNIRGVIEGLAPIFGIVGNAMKSAFSNMAVSLAPLVPILKGIGAIVIGILAVGFVAAASAALVLVAAGQLVAGVIGAIAHDAMALGKALTGNFSGAAKEFDAGSKSLENGFNGAKTSIKGVGDILGTVKDSVSELGKTQPKVNVKADTSDVSSGVDQAIAGVNGKSSTVNVKGDTSGLTNSMDLATKNPKNSTVNVKGNMTPFTNSLDLATKSSKASTVNVKGDTSQLTKSLDTATSSKKNSTVSVKGDTTQLNSSVDKATSSKKATMVKVGADTTQLTNSMNTALPLDKTSKTVKVDADTSAAKQKTAALAGQTVKGGTVQYDAKVAKPKIPTPTAPKIATIAAPKVGKPQTPQPTKVKATSIAAPKVGKPVIPQPARIKIANIPAPKIGKPSMAGVVSAVRSGMASAVAAARSGGSQLTNAVRASVNAAAAAARSGASAMQAAGSMIGAGLATGMRSQVGAVAAAANALVAQANRAARAAAKVHSPSRLFAEIGDYMGQGMALGMDGTNSLVATAGSDLATAAAGGVSSQLPAMEFGGIGAESIPSETSFNRQNPNGQTVTNNRNNQNSSAMIVRVESGAIQVISSGDGEQDGETIARKLESYLIQLDGKSMS
ncbi:hypothetical protein [Lactiplantibacillus herbarum]|uniref:hypothetical protein n=1 Tax=Lactiplantibacillus herbarum TaxID=1670446 RepID=UPI00064F4324|nr:hypothetical protein [Lactiplantibacillus herbarum]